MSEEQDDIELDEQQQDDSEPEVIEEQDEEGQPESEAEPESSAEDEVIVSIGEPTEEQETEKAPDWVRELRKNHRELQRENKELKAKLTTAPAQTPKLGPKPTLEGCDYDTEKFESELAGWYDQKKKIDEEEARITAQRENEQRAWQAKLDDYGKKKAELKIPDFDDAEQVAQEYLSEIQQAIIVKGAKNPALVMCAIGKNPKRAQELAAITDPVEYAFAVAKLETELKVTTRKPTTQPEKRIVGGNTGAGSVDSTLERLRAEAEKTGNYTKVTQYKMNKRKVGQ